MQQQANNLRAEAPTFQPTWGDDLDISSLTSPMNEEDHRRKSPVLSPSGSLCNSNILRPKALPPHTGSPSHAQLFGCGAFSTPQSSGLMMGTNDTKEGTAHLSPHLQPGKSCADGTDSASLTGSLSPDIGGVPSPPPAGIMGLRHNLSEHDLLNMAGSLLETCVYKERQ
jgi:hypothetical protein